ncbi:hypothetical protein D5F52_26625 (plasmid) [Brevibacillus laterosporus]|uniref:hypothetical protein n=1 Tax=Brevibacillus laterosporus TaxID=1465 RepID=UPI000E6B58D7|nr:hypothetical protein [Brevibacillus laterosporus]AYB41731.1 hypothetical protein D5F52_26625 [Brevibacillus laterosporus]
MTKMMPIRMHFLRQWQKFDKAILITLIVMQIIFVIGGNEPLVILSYFLFLTIGFIGVMGRTCIKKIAYKRSRKIGLKQISLFVFKETNHEIWYELHIMVPDKKTNQIGLLRDYLKDHLILYEFGKKHSKTVYFIGTSHSTFIKASEKACRQLNLEIYESDEILDPSARISSSDWKQIQKNFFRRSVILEAPNDWRTFICKIKNEEER